METTDRENAEIVKEAERLVQWGLENQHFIAAMYFARGAKEAVGRPKLAAIYGLAAMLVADKGGLSPEGRPSFPE